MSGLITSLGTQTMWGGASALKNNGPPGIYSSNVFISSDPSNINNKSTGLWQYISPISQFKNVYIENQYLQDLFKQPAYYPFGVYYASDIGLYPDSKDSNNNIVRILPDRSVNNNHARITINAAGSTTSYINAINGNSTNIISTFTGNANVSIMWPALPSSINQYTICSITRYNSGTRANILCTSDGTTVIGHNNGKTGYVQYNTTINCNGNSDSTQLDNFVSVCSRNATPSGSSQINNVYINNRI